MIKDTTELSEFAKTRVTHQNRERQFNLFFFLTANPIWLTTHRGGQTCRINSQTVGAMRRCASTLADLLPRTSCTSPMSPSLTLLPPSPSSGTMFPHPTPSPSSLCNLSTSTTSFEQLSAGTSLFLFLVCWVLRFSTYVKGVQLLLFFGFNVYARVT